jgi:hypothetical protein
MNTRSALLTPALIAGLLACGGKSDSTTAISAPIRMDPAEAAAFTATFLDMENNQIGEAALPTIERIGDALAMPSAAAPQCATVIPVSETSAKWVYVDCTGPHGWTWNGTVLVTWQVNTDGTDLVKHESQNMVGTKDGKSWTVNGVKRILRNKQTKQVQIDTEKGFTKVLNNGTESTTFEYACKLFADHSVEGQRKQWGDWSMTPQAPSTAPGASGNVDKKAPLFWDRATGCCHPVSGTLDLKRGDKAATLVFGLPCGSVTINGETKTLGACR